MHSLSPAPPPPTPPPPPPGAPARPQSASRSMFPPRQICRPRRGGGAALDGDVVDAPSSGPTTDAGAKQSRPAAHSSGCAVTIDTVLAAHGGVAAQAARAVRAAPAARAQRGGT